MCIDLSFVLLVFVLAGEFVPAVADGLSDLAEVAVAEVVEEFFEGTSDFEPRVSPCVGAVNVLFEGDMFDDMGRMAQGELEVVALHGVHAAQTGGDGVEIGSVVGAVGGGSEVVDEVARGHDGELMVEDEAHEEDGLVVFLA